MAFSPSAVQRLPSLSRESRVTSAGFQDDEMRTYSQADTHAGALIPTMKLSAGPHEQGDGRVQVQWFLEFPTGYARDLYGEVWWHRGLSLTSHSVVAGVPKTFYRKEHFHLKCAL